MRLKRVLTFDSQSIVNYRELKKDIENGRIIPFIGAGMSCFIYPCWLETLQLLNDKIECSQAKCRIGELIEKHDYEIAAKTIYERYKTEGIDFYKAIQDIFSEEKLVETKLKQSAVALLPKIFKHKPFITTNFDCILEQLCRSHESLYYDSEKLSGRLQGDSEYILKIHGDIKSGEDHLIFTENQYEQLYSNERFVQMLERIFTGKRLLFLGCGLEDRTIKLLTCIPNAEGAFHYAISDKKESFFQDIKTKSGIEIKPIIYNKGQRGESEHNGVEVILKHLLRGVNKRKKRIRNVMVTLILTVMIAVGYYAFGPVRDINVEDPDIYLNSGKSKEIEIQPIPGKSICYDRDKLIITSDSPSIVSVNGTKIHATNSLYEEEQKATINVSYGTIDTKINVTVKNNMSFNVYYHLTDGVSAGLRLPQYGEIAPHNVNPLFLEFKTPLLGCKELSLDFVVRDVDFLDENVVKGLNFRVDKLKNEDVEDSFEQYKKAIKKDTVENRYDLYSKRFYVHEFEYLKNIGEKKTVILKFPKESIDDEIKILAIYPTNIIFSATRPTINDNGDVESIQFGERIDFDVILQSVSYFQ